MYNYLKDRQHYENRYDDTTIGSCRSGERTVNDTFKILEKKLPKNELIERQAAWYLEYSKMYFWFVESIAASRYEKREVAIAKWMAEDKEKDQRLATASIAGDAYCRTCGKDTQVISKDYMHHEGRKDDDILLMFECVDCNKRMAFWQDGTEWEGTKRECEKCSGEVTSKHTKANGVITWTETCLKCGHVKTDTLDLSDNPSEPEPDDPYLGLDRKRFLFDTDMMSKYGQKLSHLERLARLNNKKTDRAEHVDIYEAIKAVKRLKISQLNELIKPVVTKEQYNDFKLGQPQVGREVSLEFSCLDAKDDREEYQSKKEIQKLIENILIDTNWRLMSEGVSYRLGYLTGRLRAFESEEDLKKLVEQRMKKGYVPKVESKESPAPNSDTEGEMDGATMRESVLVYMQNLTLGSKPAEVTLKSGKIKKIGIPILSAEMNPLLRVLIPMRDDDNSVPKFIRSYNFKMGEKADRLSKITHDSRGREIRLL
jgi:hypothetical protein